MRVLILAAAMALAAQPAFAHHKPMNSVMFLGVTTLLFDDGETAILTDGYFSRPAFATLARLEPNSAVISSSLRCRMACFSPATG